LRETKSQKRRKNRIGGLASLPEPTLKRLEDEPVRVTSIRNEQRLSKVLGFRLTPGSGCVNQLSKKGDGRTDEFVVEMKETASKRISITEEMIEKLCREAYSTGRVPVFIISTNGIKDHLPKDWVMFPAYLFE
jgi:hypothetical protein